MTDRITRIREALTRALQPAHLNIEDDSHRHKGHAGAADGRGHFNVQIVADVFKSKSPIARHRLVYAALGDMMTTDIHALSIDARTPAEAKEKNHA
jgi:BolA protein